MTVTKTEKRSIISNPSEIQKSETVKTVVEENRATTIRTTVIQGPESPTGVFSVKQKTVMSVHNTFFPSK
ncbi:Protein CBG26228 [Caenorhabditis briggsae]|nr:Protein CBG26228 [Caenorhabditis briggsae]PIC31509.1 hypothetical protein B9Z55_012189 [Caenorhabditis nigoni]UMM26471.1 hypothetical protein L5515_010157 [Caenorhabditis briggsae]CAR99863.1 Protein CBG26228 [Caenorhabditis briggsae]